MTSPESYFERRLHGRHYEYPEWAHKAAVRERDRRAAELKAKSVGPPKCCKGPAHPGKDGEAPKGDLLGGEIGSISTLNKGRAQDARGWRI